MKHALDDPGDRVGYLLWQTAHLVNRGVTAALEGYDLTPAQFGALVHTGREPGVSAAELARRINVTPQSVQTALRPLLERSWMERRSHPIHRRVLGNYLTPDGAAQTHRASDAVAEFDRRLLGTFSDEQSTDFRAGIERVLLTLNPTALDRSSLRSERPPP